MQTKQLYTIKFSVNERLIKYTNAEIQKENDFEITFIDSFTNKPITYSKKFFVSKELI